MSPGYHIVIQYKIVYKELLRVRFRNTFADFTLDPQPLVEP